MAISMLKIRQPLGRLIFKMGIAIPGKTVFLIETAPCCPHVDTCRQPAYRYIMIHVLSRHLCSGLSVWVSGVLWCSLHCLLLRTFSVRPLVQWRRTDVGHSCRCDYMIQGNRYICLSQLNQKIELVLFVLWYDLHGIDPGMRGGK